MHQAVAIAIASGFLCQKALASHFGNENKIGAISVANPVAAATSEELRNAQIARFTPLWGDFGFKKAAFPLLNKKF